MRMCLSLNCRPLRRKWGVAGIIIIGAITAGCSSDYTRNNWSLYTKGLESEQASSDSYSNSAVVDSTMTSSVGSHVGPTPMPSQDVSPQATAYGSDGAANGNGEYSPYSYSRQSQGSAAGVTRTELPPANANGAGGWSSGGNSVVVLREGETLHSVSKRYGVPVSAIMAANNIGDASQVRSGQSIEIPSYNYSANAPVSAPDNNRETQLARTTAGSSLAPLSTAVPAPSPRPSAGQRTQIAKIDAAPISEAGAATAARKNGHDETASVETASLASTATDGSAPEQTGIGEFRWPVRGRVIAGFGSKTDSGRNDGIDISVPEGTAVKAAENGVVVYAGDELEGFGNLLLIRHSDGWVSAYAHNKTLEVSRGDEVRRGQIIARSGKTGNAEMPKLHFELRKSSEPVDPLKHLGGA
jgi:murein DD-endopeptidase MepM/ murein hydrolase activator NlpD